MQPAAAKTVPDEKGRFGPFGGQFVPETLMGALEQLDREYRRAKDDPDFHRELDWYLEHFVGRPSRLYHARNLSRRLGQAKVYLKREDLNHTGAHKINNTLGQVLLALRMGKKRIIAETGAGQHGVATATAAAVFGLPCEVYMGSEDIRRQELNVYRMKLMGTKVVPVESGQRTLKDAINEAMRDWLATVETTHYVFGSVAGPHPFPCIVRDRLLDPCRVLLRAHRCQSDHLVPPRWLVDVCYRGTVRSTAERVKRPPAVSPIRRPRGIVAR